MLETNLSNDSIKLKSSYGFQFFDQSILYKDILEVQERVLEDLQKRPFSKEVYKLVGVHPETYTCGKSLSDEEFKGLESAFKNLAVVKTERGGKVMYHGPGQLTFYFIFNLKEHFMGPRDYVDSLFEAVKLYFLNQHDLELEYKKQGLWLKDKKVGFMGIRVKKGVVYHGLSLNYFTELAHFKNQSPCDIKGDEAGNIFSSRLATLFLKDEAKSLINSLPFF